MPQVKRRLAAAIEHTLLKAGASPADVERLCDEAVRYGFFAVCVHPGLIRSAADALAGAAVRVVSVVAFPHGETFAATAADEAARCVQHGAHEIDMVLPLGHARARRFDQVGAQVSAVRRAANGATLKVILETGLFDPTSLRELGEICIDAGADFLKTSTGFGPRGASIEDVALLSELARGRVGVKASGGIRDAAFALALLDAGAARLGTSSGVALLAGHAEAKPPDY